jgi:enolase
MVDTKIEKLIAREILDSRGNPTVEVEVTLACGIKARSGVPSGASTGAREAIEMRDGDKNRYGGKGVLNAVNNVKTTIASALKGMDALNQADIDNKMITLDGTENKSKLGANAILGVSLAVARAAAMAKNEPLYRSIGGNKANLIPVGCFNVLNGGVHANWQGPDCQEYMICPVGASNFRESLRMTAEIYQKLKELLKKNKYSTGVGDEGGFAPQLKSNEEAIIFLVDAIEKAGYNAGKDIMISLDPASSGFFNEETKMYELKTEKRNVTAEEMIDIYKSWVQKYPIVSIEDGLAEEDWPGWKKLNKTLGDKIELIGDDLFVTNVKYIQKGIDEQSANSVLIKLNQIGTLTETIHAVNMAKNAKWGAMVSHRSGETVDSFISDLTVALGTGHIKTGAPCRGERVEKYNQFLRIEEELGDAAKYAGRKGFIR